ncbi:hypothetical protein [Anaerosolibacter sp.]|uniref:hypothetical protein n=1 Tax=Anaerosolibacter sp. TaxID=1872527 RepID=UPI0039F14B6C
MVFINKLLNSEKRTTSRYKKPNLRFNYKTFIASDGDSERYRLLIVLEHLDAGVIEVSPFTHFFYITYRNRKYNTILRSGKIIVLFLNFLLIDYSHIYGISSLKEMNFDMGTDFLNLYGHGKIGTVSQLKSRATIEIAEGVLTVNKVLLFFSNKIETLILHDLPSELIIPFLRTAIEIAPQIALGIYLQLMGGLRISELCNLTYDCVQIEYAINDINSDMHIIAMWLNLKARKMREDNSDINS